MEKFLLVNKGWITFKFHLVARGESNKLWKTCPIVQILKIFSRLHETNGPCSKTSWWVQVSCDHRGRTSSRPVDIDQGIGFETLGFCPTSDAIEIFAHTSGASPCSKTKWCSLPTIIGRTRSGPVDITVSNRENKGSQHCNYGTRVMRVKFLFISNSFPRVIRLTTT